MRDASVAGLLVYSRAVKPTRTHIWGEEAVCTTQRAANRHQTCAELWALLSGLFAFSDTGWGGPIPKRKSVGESNLLEEWHWALTERFTLWLFLLVAASSCSPGSSSSPFGAGVWLNICQSKIFGYRAPTRLTVKQTATQKLKSLHPTCLDAVDHVCHHQ